MGCTMSETAMTQKVNDLSTELNRTKEELARCSRRFQHVVRDASEMQIRHTNELQLAQMKHEIHAGLTVREVGETASIILTDSGVMVSSSGKGQSKPVPRKVKEKQNKMEEESMNKQANLEEHMKKVTHENSQLKATLEKIKSKMEAAEKEGGPIDKQVARAILENTDVEAATKPEETGSKEKTTTSADKEESMPPPDENSRETTEEKQMQITDQAKIDNLAAKVGDLKEKLKEKTLDLAAKQAQINEQATQMFELENEIASQKIQVRKLKKDLPSTKQENKQETKISFFIRAAQFFIQLYNHLLFYTAKFLPSLVLY
uniref:moesin-like isoform X1 n=1 Tax=Myxine glutinosa TaxID=7769 RepID=UPI00358FA690